MLFMVGVGTPASRCSIEIIRKGGDDEVPLTLSFPCFQMPVVIKSLEDIARQGIAEPAAPRAY
jgi:hypothetical protein